MTETEWKAATDPRQMLQFLLGTGRNMRCSERKVRLFGVGCCRRGLHRLDSETHHRAVEVAEQFAETPPTEADAHDWQTLLQRYLPTGIPAQGVAAGIECVLGFALLPEDVALPEWVNTCNSDYAVHAHLWCVESAYQESVQQSPDHRRWHRAKVQEECAQAELLCCVVGNPFRPVAFEASWRTSAVVALAGQMYESRDFGEMPVLADALQDAGCDNADVIAHCRDPKGSHVRGCWVVDLVLGKA